MNALATLWFLATCALAVSTIYLVVSRRRARKRTEKYIDQMLLDRKAPEVTPSAHPTLETLAQAIERLTQQQQFLIRVMSERPTQPEPANRGTAKWVTPH